MNKQYNLSKLFDLLHANLAGCFPEFGFVLKGNRWQATNEEFTHSNFGCRAERIESNGDSNFGFQIHGDRFVTWFEFLTGQSAPKGDLFNSAIEKLCDRASINKDIIKDTTISNVTYVTNGFDTKPKTQHKYVPGAFNKEWHTRLIKNFTDNPKASEWAEETRGWSNSVITKYGIGLTGKYTSSIHYQYALCAPLHSKDGTYDKPYLYYSIPGLTEFKEGQDSRTGWASGRPKLYYSDKLEKQSTVIAVEGMKDLWSLKTIINDPDILIVTSTHGAGKNGGKQWPEEYNSPEFWGNFKNVYLGFDDDDTGHSAMELLVAQIPQETKIIKTTHGKDWNDFILNGGKRHQFNEILSNAKPLQAELPVTAKEVKNPKEIDINGAYHNGHLYWVTERLVQQKVDGKTHEGWESMVVRSDGSLLKAVQSAKVSASCRPVIRLTDNTLISREPRANPNGTWEWSSISQFIEHKNNGAELPITDFSKLVESVYNHFRSIIWLPHKDDLAVITLATIATYCQEIFDAVPLVLFNGSKGSGKSQIGYEASKLMANGVFLGRATIAAIIDTADAARGGIVIDDYEELGGKGKGKADPTFSDVTQVIKMSYKKDTGTYVKISPDGRSRTTQRFYGVKFVNNTQGVDSIVGDRMFVINTRKIPQELVENFQSNKKIILDSDIPEIRNQLHTWTFNNVATIHKMYTKYKDLGGDRQDEIAAPLLALAKISGQRWLIDDLESVLERRKNSASTPDEETAFDMSLENIIEKGYEEVTANLVINEMGLILGRDFGKEAQYDIPTWAQVKHIGRKLTPFVDAGGHRRSRLQHGVQARFNPFQRSFLSEVKNRLERQNRQVAEIKKEGRDFCQGCDDCAYRSSCNILKSVNNLDTKNKN